MLKFDVSAHLSTLQGATMEFLGVQTWCQATTNETLPRVEGDALSLSEEPMRGAVSCTGVSRHGDCRRQGGYMGPEVRGHEQC